MNKLVVSFMVLFFIAIICSAIMEGGGGISATQLTADITDASVTLNVASTNGFLRSDYVQIGNEKIQYTNKTATTFTGLTRGWDGTTAAAHSSGSKVYSPDAEIINSALGFNVASTGATFGAISIPVILGNFFFTTLPRIIIWDYAWLKDGWLQYLRYLLIMCSIGFLIYMAYNIASALGGVMQRMWAR